MIIRNEQEDDEQSTDAFNYALESLQMIAQTTGNHAEFDVKGHVNII